MRKRSGNAGASASSRRRSVCATVLGAAFVSLMPLSGAAESGQDAGQQGTGPEPLKALVGRLRKEEKLVGLAAMVMIDGKVVASAADGERKIGSRVPVRLGDRWHVGSITKSMTATMIARLVEAGKLQWTDTISTHFRDATIHEDWKPVTLRQLLTHTSGAPSNFSTEVKRNRPAPGPESTRSSALSNQWRNGRSTMLR